MRSTPARLAGATAALALVALPALAFGQQSSPSPAPGPGSPSTSPPPAVAPSPSSGSSGSSGTSRDGYSGGSSYGSGYSSPSRGDYGGGRYDGPSRYAPGSPGRGGSGMPPTRVELPPPRAGQPGGVRGIEPVAPGRPTPGPVSPGRPIPDPGSPGRVPSGGQAGFGQPGYGAPGRMPFEGPGRVELPGHVQIPGVVGVPEKPGMTDVVRDPQQGDEDTRLLPPPITPIIGPPVVGKPVPQPTPPQPPPATYQPPPTPSDYLANYYFWLMRSWGWGYPGYYGSCYRGMITEEDEYWARVRGYYDNYGCGYGYGYGHGYGYYRGYWRPYGYGYSPYSWYDYAGYGNTLYGALPLSLYFLNLQPCAVVTAETYSGRRYSIVTMLPEFGAYGPIRLRQELQMRLKEDGEVTLHGRGSQELHLFDGFVRRVTTRWCGPGEW